jgi:hypothetical protein
LQNFENSNLTRNLWNLTHIKLIFSQKFTFHTLTLVVSCTKSLEKDAKLLLKADKIISNGSIYEYTNKNNLLYTINPQTKPCSCHYFSDSGICRHLVAVAIKENIQMPGLNQTKKKLNMIIRRRLRMIVHSDDENDDEISEENPEIGREFQENHNQIQIEETYSTQSLTGRPSLASKALNRDIEIVPTKKKRGRKPKQQQNQANDSKNNVQASQVIHGTQYGITRRRKATQSNDQ